MDEQSRQEQSARCHRLVFIQQIINSAMAPDGSRSLGSEHLPLINVKFD
jgi:hypothetical protein